MVLRGVLRRLCPAALIFTLFASAADIALAEVIPGTGCLAQYQRIQECEEISNEEECNARLIGDHYDCSWYEGRCTTRFYAFADRWLKEKSPLCSKTFLEDRETPLESIGDFLKYANKYWFHEGHASPSYTGKAFAGVKACTECLGSFCSIDHGGCQLFQNMKSVEKEAQSIADSLLAEQLLHPSPTVPLIRMKADQAVSYSSSTYRTWSAPVTLLITPGKVNIVYPYCSKIGELDWSKVPQVCDRDDLHNTVFCRNDSEEVETWKCCQRHGKPHTKKESELVGRFTKVDADDPLCPYQERKFEVVDLTTTLKSSFQNRGSFDCSTIENVNKRQERRVRDFVNENCLSEHEISETTVVIPEIRYTAYVRWKCRKNVVFDAEGNASGGTTVDEGECVHRGTCNDPQRQEKEDEGLDRCLADAKAIPGCEYLKVYEPFPLYRALRTIDENDLDAPTYSVETTISCKRKRTWVETFLYWQLDQEAPIVKPWPTPTGTPTPTPTETSTPVPTPTETSTPVPTPTGTSTPMPTPTWTPTPTPTWTPVPTPTPTPTMYGSWWY